MKPRYNQATGRGAALRMTLLAVACCCAPALAQVGPYKFDMPRQPLAAALQSYGQTAERQIIFTNDLVRDRLAPELRGNYSAEEALSRLLEGTDLVATKSPEGVIMIQRRPPVTAAPPAPSVIPAAAAVSSVQQDRPSLEEIVVTARKRSESLVAVPVAVTAFSAKDLASRGVLDPLVDVATYTPGFTYQNQSVNRNDRGFRSFVIRGMVPGNPTSLRQSVSVFIDGTAVVGGNVEGITNIERVEIVKGPQSAYFGRATFAGAINYITMDPSDEWGGSVAANSGSRGLKDLSLTVEGPLVGDWLSFRASGRSFHTDGQYPNREIPGDRLGRRNTDSLSLTLLATPGDKLRAKLFMNIWEDDDGPPANAQYNNAYHNCNAGAAPAGTLNYICGELGRIPTETQLQNTVLTPSAIQVLTGAIGPGYSIVAPDFLDRFGLHREAYQVHGSVDYEFSNGMVLGLSGAFDENKWAFLTDTTFRDTRSIPNPNFGVLPNVVPYFSRSAYGVNIDSNHSLELRLTSAAGGPFTWLLGANYFHARSDQLTNAFGPAGFIPATPINRNEIDTYGVFGSVGYEITEQFSVSAEARSQTDRLSQKSAAGTNRIDNPANIVARKTFDSFTPRVIAQYKPSADLTVYASYAEGTRPGQFNTLYYTLAPDIKAQVDAVTSVAAAVPEEQVAMTELGVKGVFFERRLRVLAALYQGRWTNRHIPTVINTFRNGVLFQQLPLTQPGGKTELQGFEIEAAFQATDELTLEGTLSVAESDIRATFCSDCRLITGNPTPVGTQLPFYPRTKGTLSAQYQRAVSSRWDGFARADYIYTGKVFESEANVAWTSPTSKANLRVGVSNEDYSIELYGTNIFDDLTPTSLARNTDSLTGTNAISVSLPDRATFGIRVSARF